MKKAKTEEHKGKGLDGERLVFKLNDTTKREVFTAVAEANNYDELPVSKLKINETTTTTTTYVGDEITDEVLGMNIVEREMDINEKLIKVTVEETTTVEITNPNYIEKLHFGRKILNDVAIGYINECIAIVANKEIERQIDILKSKPIDVIEDVTLS